MLQDPQQQKEYNKFIKESVENGSYFKDALEWYMFRYVNPFCERTILLIVAAIAIFVTYNLFFTIKNMLPIKEQLPIIIKAKDEAVYFPVIKKLRDSKNIRTVDEAIAKYLLIRYLKEREEYDFRRSDIEAVNTKFNIIKNNSSPEEYRDFQSFMNENNPNSPIINFGKNVTRNINIDSFDFKRIQINNFIDKTRDFISLEIPTEAEVKYEAITTVNGNPTSQTFLNRIFFKFEGVSAKDKEVKNKKLNFTVTDYKIYLVK